MKRITYHSITAVLWQRMFHIYFMFLSQLIIKEIKKEMEEIVPLLLELFVVIFILFIFIFIFNFGTTVQR